MNVIRKNIATHPELARYSLGTVSVSWSHHAKERAQEKSVPRVTCLNVALGTIVETETDSRNKILKLVVRVSRDAKSDAVYVIVPDVHSRGVWRIVTVWVNGKDDTHKTLDKSRINRAA